MENKLKNFLSELCPGLVLYGPNSLIGLTICIRYNDLRKCTICEKVQKVIVEEDLNGEFELIIPLMPGYYKSSLRVPFSGEYDLYPPGFVKYYSFRNQGWKMSNISNYGGYEIVAEVDFKVK